MDNCERMRCGFTGSDNGAAMTAPASTYRHWRSAAANAFLAAASVSPVRFFSVLSSVLVIIASAGCAGAYQNEGGFVASPDGKWVASVFHRSIDIPFTTEGISLYQSVTLRIRRSDGKLHASVLIAKGKELDDINYGHTSLSWSPDSRTVAYRNGTNLSVFDVKTKRSRRLADSATACRWVAPSTIMWLSGWNKVMRTSISDGKSTVVHTAGKADDFHPGTEDYHNPLSPSGTHLICADAQGIRVIDLKSGSRIAHTVERGFNPSFCWWSDSGNTCLIYGFRTFETGRFLIKTRDISIPETGTRDIMYLYQRNEGKFTKLTAGLVALNGKSTRMIRPSAGGRVWSPDGKWFMAGGGRRLWICHVKPWLTVCIQDSLDPQFARARIAPAGSCIAVVKSKNEFDAAGDLFVIDVSIDPKRGILLKSSKKVARVSLYSWFWSSDGKSIIVFERGRFHSFPVPPGK